MGGRFLMADDNLEALLGLSVETIEALKRAERETEVEAAKERHPSGKAIGTTAHRAIEEYAAQAREQANVKLTAADRCDADCSAAALYRVEQPLMDPDAWVGFGEPGGPRKQEAPTLDWCRHHFYKHFPSQVADGWKVTGANPDLFAELHANRLKGSDHA